jgi:tRNA G18 (ribose-2'-O)-methylase SpoU
VLKVSSITSLDLPALRPYRTMKQQGDHFVERLFVAEGGKVVRQLLKSDLAIVSALMTPEHFEALKPHFEERSEMIEVFLGEKPLLETLTGFTMFQGLLACARIPQPTELAVALALTGRPRFFVATDALSNAENLGGLIRSAAAFGAEAIVVGETCAHPYLRRAVRASMGTVFDLKIVEPLSMVDALREMRGRGIHCVGAHPHEDRWLTAAQLTGDCCIVVGSEGHGLSEKVRDACDELVAVPMARGIDSLNVGAASSIFFYEVWRQRNRVKTNPAPAHAGARGASCP